MGQTAPRQSGPGVSTTHGVRDHPIPVHRRQKPPIETGEAVPLGLAPDAPFGVEAGKIAQTLLRSLLGPSPKTIGDVVAGDDQVASVRSPPRHQDMGMGLIGVEVTDRHPRQVRLAEVGADPSHHVAGVVA
ncbi:hypothetical protein D3C81_1537180 [compost metagenome]